MISRHRLLRSREVAFRGPFRTAVATAVAAVVVVCGVCGGVQVCVRGWRRVCARGFVDGWMGEWLSG